MHILLLKGKKDLLAVAANENDKVDKNVILKNNDSFTSSISKTNNA